MAKHNPGRTPGDGPATTLVPADVLRFGLPVIELLDAPAYCARTPGVHVAVVAHSRVRVMVLWRRLLEALPHAGDQRVYRAADAEEVTWPNGSRMTLWRPMSGGGHGPVIDKVVLGSDLPADVATHLLAATLTSIARHSPPAAAISAAAAFEQAYARVKAVGAATTEHMNALADLTDAGVTLWQLRAFAGVMSASPEELMRRLNPILGRGKHPGLIAAIDAADEED